jgi:hypothetical protein
MGSNSACSDQKAMFDDIWRMSSESGYEALHSQKLKYRMRSYMFKTTLAFRRNIEK